MLRSIREIEMITLKRPSVDKILLYVIRNPVRLTPRIPGRRDNM